MAAVDFLSKRDRGEHKKKNKPYYFRQKKKPLVLVFDEKERQDFLTGFRKRKLQRKKKAQDELEEQLKVEKKRVRLEAKDALKRLVLSNRDIPELGEMYTDPDIVDMETHEVEVTELDPARLARENNWIGANKVRYEEEKEAEEESEPEDNTNEIEGMETKPRRQKTEKTGEESNPQLKTRKDIKKYVKKIATKTVQTSKIFQKKKNIEKAKNIKKKKKDERKMERTNNSKKVKGKKAKHKGRR